MKAQAAALERTPPRTPASERAGRRLAVHQAISPQELAAGARASAKRSAQILRLEAEAAAKRAAARELEDIRGALSQRSAKAPSASAASAAQLGSPADLAGAIDDAASTMAAWANSMRSRLSDKDAELAQMRAVLEAGRENAATRSNAGQAQVYDAVHYAQSLAAQLAAANREIDQLRSALSTSAQRSVHLEAQWKVALQEESVRCERWTAEQLEFDNLRQRCETAERMLWLIEEKALADEEAWSQWRMAALKRIELLQDAVDAHERSAPPQQRPGAPGARVHWAEERSSNSDLSTDANFDGKNALSTGAASFRSDQDWPWDGVDNEDDEDHDDEDHDHDSHDITDRVDEMWSFSETNAGRTVGRAEQIETLRREQQLHVDLRRVDEQIGSDEEERDEDDENEEVDSNAIWKLRDELTVLNAKVKGLEDELEDELEGSEDQASTQVRCKTLSLWSTVHEGTTTQMQVQQRGLY